MRRIYLFTCLPVYLFTFLRVRDYQQGRRTV